VIEFDSGGSRRGLARRGRQGRRHGSSEAIAWRPSKLNDKHKAFLARIVDEGPSLQNLRRYRRPLL
jgi:hypothetical protein